MLLEKRAESPDSNGSPLFPFDGAGLSRVLVFCTEAGERERERQTYIYIYIQSTQASPHKIQKLGFWYVSRYFAHMQFRLDECRFEDIQVNDILALIDGALAHPEKTGYLPSTHHTEALAASTESSETMLMT